MSARPRHHRRIGLRLIITLTLLVILLIALIFFLSQPVSAPGEGDSSAERILFISNRAGSREIYVADADDRNEIKLTNNPSDDLVRVWML